jgi:cytoskeletal protein CcmA (bactofilin family)
MLQRIKPFFLNGGVGRSEKRRSVIGRGLTIRGDVQGEQNLQVWGCLEGNVFLTGDVTIAAGAEVQADISATRIIVAGDVTGNLLAAEKVEVLPTGKVRGNIQTKGLVIYDGASLTGEVRAGLPPESRLEQVEESRPEERPTSWHQE